MFDVPIGSMSGSDSDMSDSESDRSESSKGDGQERENGGESTMEVVQASPEEIDQLKAAISANPYVYDNHPKLIEAERSRGNWDGARSAREQMRALFPLSADLWLAWIRDEQRLAAEQGRFEERATFTRDLFEAAVGDYQAPEIWLEFVNFAAENRCGEAEGMDRDWTCSIMDRAVRSAGAHPTVGPELWKAFIQFRLSLLSGTKPETLTGVKDAAGGGSGGVKDIADIYERALSCPTNAEDLDALLGDFELFADTHRLPGPRDRLYGAHRRSLQRLRHLAPLEQAIAAAAPPRLDEWMALARWVVANMPAEQASCAIERALSENCLEPSVWLFYLHFLDVRCGDITAALAVCARALRNCPWSGALHADHLRLIERSAAAAEDQDCGDRMDAALDEALRVGVEAPAELRRVWMAYLGYRQRSLKGDFTAGSAGLERLESALQKCVEQMAAASAADGGDFEQLRRVYTYWIRLEARRTRNMTRARELFAAMLDLGYSESADAWLELLDMERAHGDLKHARRVIQRALKQAKAGQERLVARWVELEGQEGTLDGLYEALKRSREVMEQVEQRKQAISREKEKRKAKQEKARQKGATTAAVAPAGAAVAPAGAAVAPAGAAVKPTSQAAGKRRPSAHLSASAEEPAAKRQVSAVAATDESEGKWSKLELERKPRNISYSLAGPEERLASLLAQCGRVEQVELVRNPTNEQLKGFGYVQFESPASVERALMLDRHPLEGRPLFISRVSKDRSQRGPALKFNAGREPNKIFVSNLSRQMGRDALMTAFTQYGPIRDARIVTTRAGASKGCAYVEFELESSANEAVAKANGMLIGDQAISVAISDPPSRAGNPGGGGSTGGPAAPRAGGAEASRPQPAGAKAQTAPKPALPFGVPRSLVTSRRTKVETGAVAGKPRSAAAALAPGQAAADGDAAAPDTATLSNADFRAMLLKK